MAVVEVEAETIILHQQQTTACQEVLVVVLVAV
jgi:hypothetical protein